MSKVKFPRLLQTGFNPAMSALDIQAREYQRKKERLAKSNHQSFKTLIHSDIFRLNLNSTYKCKLYPIFMKKKRNVNV